MQWGKPPEPYGPWDISPHKQGWRISQFDECLRGMYGPALREQIMALSDDWWKAADEGVIKVERRPLEWFHDHFHWHHDDDGSELGGEG